MQNKLFAVTSRAIKLASAGLLLTSCAATQTAIEHRNLEVSTKLSETIFLDPVPDSQKTIYVSIKNTAEENFVIENQLKQAFSSKGYRVFKNPEKAHYLLQANVLKVGKMSKTASQNALGGGYGSVLAGAGTGAAIGALSGYSNATLAGGIAGGIGGLVADSLVKAVSFSVITDVQISERVGKGQHVRETFNAALAKGNSSSTSQSSTKLSQFERYRTRVVSTADQVNLTVTKARPALEQGLVKTLAGIF